MAISSSNRRSPWAWLYDTFIRSWGIIYSFFTVTFRRWRSHSRDWQRVSLWSGYKRRQWHNTCWMGSSAYDHGTSLSGCRKGLNFYVQLDDWFAVRNLNTVSWVYIQEGISCELIDLKTLLPWDRETVEASVKKTGRLLVSLQRNWDKCRVVCCQLGLILFLGVADKPWSSCNRRFWSRDLCNNPRTLLLEGIKKKRFIKSLRLLVVMCYKLLFCLQLEAPVSRVCGLDTPFPLVFEPFYMPTKNKASSSSSYLIFSTRKLGF